MGAKSKSDKKSYFEYFLHKLYEKINSDRNNDLSIIKTQKLLYFLINSVPEEGNQYPLLNTFDKFYALPYGHVESDIYDSIKKDELQSVVVDRFGMNVRERVSFDSSNLDQSILKLIDQGIFELDNKKLLEKNSSYLVDLSHCHESWIKNYRIALSEQRSSHEISKEDILNEDKFFAL